MPSILIANLGNRNLKYRGEFLDKDKFRDLTHKFWENYETECAHFDPVLLNEHLDDQQVEQIYLITTDQADSRYRAGDTLHEGAILQRLFAEDFPGWPIELLPYQGNPTVEAEIYPQLKPRLLAIVNKYPNHNILFLDAGGTPQLKNAVREYLRYAAGPARFRAVYTTPQDERREIDQTYHQRYQLLRVAREFIRTYQYRAAHDVLAAIEPATSLNSLLLKLLLVAALRKTFNRKAAQQVGAGRPLPAVFADYIKSNAELADDLVDFPDDFAERQRLDIAELASLSQFYLQQQQYELGIPTYYRLCEEIGQCFADYKQHRLRSNTDKDAFISATRGAVAQHFAYLDRYGVPYLLGYARAEGSLQLQALMKELTLTISHVNGTPIQVNGQRVAEKGLNVLRNRCFLAHGNEPITKATIEAEAPGFLGPSGRAARIFKLLGLPNTNVYDQMNEEILALFDQE